VKRAREFSEDIIQVDEWLDANHRPSRNLWADYVSGEMPTIARKQRLKRLRNVGNDEIGLLSNARCLSEGVDVPALDGVAFIDPRSSEIDIIQSVGRAIRLSKSKTMGTVVIPVFIGRTDDAERALEASDFKPIWDVLEALRSHDESLSDELDQLRIELGAKRRRSVGSNDLTKIVFDLPTFVNEGFAETLRVHLVAQTTESWMFWYGMLETFAKQHGHCRVPQSYVEGTFNLGTWVSWQRGHRDTMSPERQRRLEAIGFVWDILENVWEEGFAALTAFKTREGHCGVPDRHIEGRYRLGQWVGVQRANEETMPAERKQRLNVIGFLWDPYKTAWEEGFAALKTFQAREGHCLVPALHFEGTFKLGRWVNKQRTSRDKISAERRKRLDAIEFVWDVLEKAWEVGFAALKKFQAREGHCLVPRPHVEGTFELWQWIIVQRTHRDKMSSERAQRLDAIGFVWDAREGIWEEGLAALKKFQAREGHCLVPRTHLEGTFKLGTWVGNQRTKRNLMSAEHRQRLDAIGFVWNPYERAWDEGFAALKTFQAREGHCLVPALHVEGTFKLGTWVGNQRADRDKMSSERAQRLDAIGFVWDPREGAWEEGFAVLKNFQAREGNCLVPALHVEGRYRLGQWVNVQRNIKETMPPERKRRLDAIGFVWDAREVVWEEGLAALKKFQVREGHCLLPPGHVEGNYKLGSWVYSQRANKDAMPAERRQRLNAIGFVWDPQERAWEEGFAALKTFQAREGDCRVPRPHVEGSFKLGMWVHNQRRNRDAMPAERRRRLDAIGFVWRGR
jgi:Helicase associated domain/Helicase conserved C-terminal domain